MSSSRTKRKRPRDEAPDEDRPLCSWKSLPKEVLQLKCNKHNLSAPGSVATMASRLYTFFHEEPAVQDNPGEQEETLVRSLMPGIQQLVRDELSRLHTKGSSTSSQKSKSKSKDRRTSTEDNVQQPGPSKGRGQPAKSRGSRRSASSSSSGSFHPTSKKHRPSRPKSSSVINSHTLQAVPTCQSLPAVQGQVWIVPHRQTPQTVVKKDGETMFHTLTTISQKARPRENTVSSHLFLQHS